MRRVFLIRHGECYMNLDLAQKVGGRSNESPLTPLGKAQAAALGTALSDKVSPYIQRESLICFSSTALRTQETANLVMSKLGLDCSTLKCSEKILEIDMGDWEGALRSMCYTENVLEQIESDCHNFAPPNGESQKQVEERMINFLHNDVCPSIPRNGAALVFGHGLAFKTTLRYILDSDPRHTRNIGLDNTGIIELMCTCDDADNINRYSWRVLRVNDSSHLQCLEGIKSI